MAIGDSAAAAGMPLVAGSLLAKDIDTEINRTRDFIADRTTPVVPVVKGGTGATTAAAARVNLDAANRPSTTVAGSAVGVAGHGLVAVDEATLALKRVTGPIDAAYIPTTLPGDRWVSGGLAVAGTVTSGASTVTGSETVQGHLFVPNSTAAVSGFTVAYINSDGRLSRGSSSERYKKFISERDPAELGDLFAAPFVRYQMRGGEAQDWRYGYIAESLVGTDMAPFVVAIDGVVESIDFIGLLLAQVAQLNARLAVVENRIAGELVSLTEPTTEAPA